MHHDAGQLSITAVAGAVTDEALQALAAVSSNGLAVLDGDGRFLAVNDAAAQIVDFSATNLLGQPSPFAAEESASTVEEWRSTCWTTPDGRRRHLDYRITPLPEVGYVVWFSDGTDARRQRERLTAIVRAASTVADAGSLRATLDAVAQEIVETANIAAVQILAVDHPRDELRVLGMAGFGNAQCFIQRLQECQRLGARVWFLYALERGESVVVPQRKQAVMSDPAWAPLHTIMGYPDWDSFVSMPMQVRDHTVGVINAYYHPGEDPGPNSLAFLGAMADHAAVAIDTASLLSQARSRAQQDERRRLARDLHDSVVQELFSMRMQAKALRAELDHPGWKPAQVYRGAEELVEFSQSALVDLRRLIFELHPLDLGEQSLIDAVEEHAASLRARTGLVVDVRVSAELDLSYNLDVQEDLYRIIQEALHNVIKHADSATADVLFDTADGDDLIVEVSDDGRGSTGLASQTAAAIAARQDSLGLVSMRERAERWGGEMVAGPRSDGGWAVRVTLPAQRGPARRR